MHISRVLNVKVNFSVPSRGEDHWRYHGFFTRYETSRVLGYKFGSLADPFELRDFIGSQFCDVVNDSNASRYHLGADSKILEEWNHRDISFGFRSTVAISAPICVIARPIYRVGFVFSQLDVLNFLKS